MMQNEQITSAYEQGMSVEEIAAEFSLDEVAVKATLYQNSEKYRSSTKQEKSLKFNESEQEAAKAAIVRIMNGSDDDYLVLRAAKYIRDDAEGRLDNPLKGLKSMNVNVLMFNQQLLRAREGKQRSKALSNIETPAIEDKSGGKPIDIESEQVAA